MSNFAKRLRKLRKENDLTQEELGKKLGYNKSNVSHLESGRNKPQLDVLLKLSEIFDITVDYLVGKTDHKNASRISSEDVSKEQLKKLKKLFDEFDLDYIEVISEAKEKNLSPKEIKEIIRLSNQFKNLLSMQN